MAYKRRGLYPRWVNKTGLEKELGNKLNWVAAQGKIRFAFTGFLLRLLNVILPNKPEGG